MSSGHMSGGAPRTPFWVEDPDGAAGEYVLGTLDSAERVTFAEALDRDPPLRAAVAAWEARQAPLAVTAQPVTPGPGVWTAIETRIGAEPTTARDADGSTVLRLKRGIRRWRLAAGAATALAAGLALWLVVGPRPIASGRQYLAVVDRGGACRP